MVTFFEFLLGYLLFLDLLQSEYEDWYLVQKSTQNVSVVRVRAADMLFI